MLVVVLTIPSNTSFLGLCKRLIDALQVCLNNMDLECPDDVFVTEGKKLH